MEKKNKTKPRKNILETEKEKAAVTDKDVSSSVWLVEQIKKACEGLYYISETDAEFVPLIGQTSETVTAEEVLKQTNSPANAAVEHRDFADFFSRLTKIEDWFGDEEKENAQKFVHLKEVLENNLRELNVFKIGKIRLDIYVVGLDENDKLLGIKTKAVET